MTGIWEFPEVEELRDFFVGGLELARDLSAEEGAPVEDIELARILVIDEWGRGTAEIGENRLELVGLFDIEGSQEEIMNAGIIANRFIAMINDGEISPPELAREWFDGFNLDPGPIGQMQSQINFALGDRVGNTIFDLTTLEIIELREGGTVRRTSLEIFRSRQEEEEEPEEPEEPSEPQQLLEPEEPEEPELTEEERLAEEFPGIEPPLRTFAVSDDELDIPAGKETKRVENRELMEFEILMGLPFDAIRDFGLDAATRRLGNGIGLQAEAGTVGVSEPPANFPRTSSYIRNRLLFEGPTYILNLYNELVFYSGFISGFYDMRLKPGTYRSFREFIWRLKEIPERGGPQLIEYFNQQQAAQRGLETLPDHPTIPGEKAPWLEMRQYIDIEEDNADHEAWQDPTDFLYNQLEAPGQT